MTESNFPLDFIFVDLESCLWVWDLYLKRPSQDTKHKAKPKSTNEPWDEPEVQSTSENNICLGRA